jgi:Lrp/AsnC family transcriptional regulator, leucine-responsive regulatory protein
MGVMTMTSEAHLDEIDRRILEELQEGARITYTELGRRVALTAPAVADRVRRLEEAGVITGFRTHLEPAMLGYSITAFIRWTAAGQDCAQLGEVAKEIPEIVECHRITGENSYVLKVVARDVQHLEGLIDRLMPWGSTITSVVTSSPVRHRTLQPAVAAGEPSRGTGSRTA